MAFTRKRISLAWRTAHRLGKSKQEVADTLFYASTPEEALENSRELLELFTRGLSEGKRSVCGRHYTIKLDSDRSVVEKEVELLRHQVEVLEHLVLETSRPRDIPDTTNGAGGA